MLIDMQNITKEYRIGDIVVKALDDVSFSVKEHEFVAIVGPSGSGKSTLMNIIGCLDTPTSGTYKIEGQQVTKMKEDSLAEIRSNKIGFIFQRYNLLNQLSALENVELPLIYKGMRPKAMRERAFKYLEFVGLSDKILNKPVELSGGQQQRVAIARALAGHPPIILADEPTGALDSKSGAEILGIIKELHAKGNTIILITHDNKIAAEAKRIVRIQDGKIIEDVEVK